MSHTTGRKPSVLDIDIPGQFSANNVKLQLPATVTELLEAQENNDNNNNNNNNYPYTEHTDSHSDFRSASEPWLWNKQKRRRSSLLSASKADLRCTNQTFPGLQHRSTILSMAAWFSFLCTIDDTVESMEPSAARRALAQSIAILKLPRPDCCRHDGGADTPLDTHHLLTDGPAARIAHVSYAFCRHVRSLLPGPTYRRVVCQSASNVLGGIRAEIAFRASGGAVAPPPAGVDEYMRIRTRTIGIAPLVALFESEVLGPDHVKSGVLRLLEGELNVIVGLQNDLLGLEKDVVVGEAMNFVLVDSGVANTCLGEMTDDYWGRLREGVGRLAVRHNESLQLARRLRNTIISRPEDDGEKDVAERLYLLSATHFYWASAARRYRVSCSE